MNLTPVVQTQWDAKFTADFDCEKNDENQSTFDEDTDKSNSGQLSIMYVYTHLEGSLSLATHCQFSTSKTKQS